MTFDDLLAQVQALLQREQRLSYRALQRRFALEEADLEALKDELIYAKRLVVDEDDRVLVWAGDASTTPAPASQALQSTTTHADSQTSPPPSHDLSAGTPSPPEGVLTTRLEQQQGVRLAIRVGVHTGPVVVGEMGEGS
jgi:hypothetical protein